ncbi:hypothetical protein ACFOZ0_05055 [Streptomyces yaanensis]|uniref:Uncharacterized protein n=1 Tax=Streptomyces yaanensis TaxID=1142239 RepID=A0ABV7S788_9ACTN
MGGDVFDAVFTAVARTFLERYRGSSATTADCVAVASEVSGRDRSGFPREWLYGTTTPRMPGHPHRTVTPVTPYLATPHSRADGHYHEASATP